MSDSAIRCNNGLLSSIRTIVEDATKSLAGAISRNCGQGVDLAGVNALILRECVLHCQLYRADNRDRERHCIVPHTATKLGCQ